MTEITYLRSQRKRRLRTHYALRGLDTPVRDGGRSWWFVYDDIDHPPELVGAEESLPKHAYDELQRLRKAPKVGDRRAARHIGSSLMFTPDTEDNGVPHAESVEWLRQYKRRSGSYSVERSYMVAAAHPGQEDPCEIWESWGDGPTGLLDSTYRLVWLAEDEE